MDQKSALIELAESLAAHQGVTHFAISMRALGKGDFFKNLKEKGAGCTLKTASKLLGWFDANWPADLAWPEASIARPSKKQEAA